MVKKHACTLHINSVLNLVELKQTWTTITFFFYLESKGIIFMMTDQSEKNATMIYIWLNLIRLKKIINFYIRRNIHS